MTTTKGKQEFWRQFWLGEEQPWDQKGPHRYLNKLLEAAETLGGLKKGDRILVPGCGRAHNAAEMARRGYNVTACDYVPEAIACAKESYGASKGLRLRVQNALEPLPEEVGHYDGVFDRAMLCALQPASRLLFIDSCHEHLKVGGLFMSLTFTAFDHEFEGPPFYLTIEELKDLMMPRFRLVHGESYSYNSQASRIREELMNIWQKV